MIKNSENYKTKIYEETKNYKDKRNIHDLPDIFHYWSNKYLKPKLEPYGIIDIESLFTGPIIRKAKEKNTKIKVASIGPGNCELEINIIERCKNYDIEIHCYEIISELLKIGEEKAKEQGVIEYIKFINCDVNYIEFNEKYDIFIANQSLHHLVELEYIFKSIKNNINPDGYFIISDMIGRNGHMLWPEAYQIVCQLWPLLDKKKKWNHLLKRHEEIYENWDCSKEGFEGIRSQDILPLLIKNFNFELFCAFIGFIDVFIGRAFGKNYDPLDPLDKAFIDFIALLDEKYIKEGLIKPTHLIARMKVEKPNEVYLIDGLDPKKCIRY